VRDLARPERLGPALAAALGDDGEVRRITTKGLAVIDRKG
jgi:hypothetical protein